MVSAVQEDQAPTARPRREGSKAAPRIARLAGIRMAAPTPWRARAAMSCPMLCASPHPAEAMAKITIPSAKRRRRPKKSPSEPAGSRRAARSRA